MECNHLLVVDTETSSLDILTTQVLEIACVAIDSASMRPITESAWSSLVRPEDEATIEPAALAKNKLNIEELRLAPPVKVVMDSFNNHVRRFFTGKTKSQFKAPYLAGMNVRRFDGPILARYCKRFKLVDDEGEPKMFSRRVIYDVHDDFFRWFGQTDALPNLTLDTVREYLGIPKDKAHRAMADVEQTAWVICKFLRLYRTLHKKIPFKDAWKNGEL